MFDKFYFNHYCYFKALLLFTYDLKSKSTLQVQSLNIQFFCQWYTPTSENIILLLVTTGLDAGNRSRRQESEGGAALSKNISMILEVSGIFSFLGGIELMLFLVFMLHHRYLLTTTNMKLLS